jgi:hypothetical protein
MVVADSLAIGVGALLVPVTQVDSKGLHGQALDVCN